MRLPFFRRRPLTEETKNDVASKDADRYRTRSRCLKCKDFVIEGSFHTCPVTEETTRHENPAAPKPKPEDRK